MAGDDPGGDAGTGRCIVACAVCGKAGVGADGPDGLYLVGTEGDCPCGSSEFTRV